MYFFGRNEQTLNKREILIMFNSFHFHPDPIPSQSKVDFVDIDSEPLSPCFPPEIVTC